MPSPPPSGARAHTPPPPPAPRRFWGTDVLAAWGAHPRWLPQRLRPWALLVSTAKDVNDALRVQWRGERDREDLISCRNHSSKGKGNPTSSAISGRRRAWVNTAAPQAGDAWQAAAGSGPEAGEAGLFSPNQTDGKSQAAEARAPLCLGGKGSTRRRRRLEFDPWVRKMPWRTGWHPRRWSCLGILWTEGPGGLLGSPESGTTERLNSSHKPGEGLEGCYRHEE